MKISTDIIPLTGYMKIKGAGFFYRYYTPDGVQEDQWCWFLSTDIIPLTGYMKIKGAGFFYRYYTPDGVHEDQRCWFFY